MDEEKIIQRLNNLLAENTEGPIGAYSLFQGALSLMIALYGPDSPQVRNFTDQGSQFQILARNSSQSHVLHRFSLAAIRNMKSEVEAGLIGSLQQAITGDVLTDFLKLARAALDESGDDAKNVAAVLTAALYEDTLRRLATAKGIPHIEKLQDVITALKDKGILQGPQVGIAQSYLNFRNKSLHAQWDQVERASVAGVLGFVEELLLKHFA